MMSMRFVLTTVMGVLVLAAVAVGAPYIGGSKIEQQFIDSHKRFSQVDIKFELITYERGWFASTAKSLVTIHGRNGQDIEVVLTHQIEHGPTPTNLRLARVTSTPSFERTPELEATLKQLFGDQPVARIVSEVKFNGSQQAEFTSPHYEGPLGSGGATVQWQGVEGTIMVSAELDVADSTFKAPKLIMQFPQGITIDLAGIDIDWSAIKPAGQDYWLGESRFSIKQISLINDERVDQRAVSAPGIVRLQNAYINSRVENTSPTLLSISVDMGADKVTVDAESFADVRFDTAFNNISATTYGAMTKQLEEVQKRAQSEEEMAQLMMLAMFELIPKFLASQPEFAIKQIGIKQDGDELLFNGVVKYVGQGDIMMFNPYQDLQATASLMAAEPMVTGFGQKILAEKLKRSMRQQGQVMDAAMEAQMDALAGQQLQMMLIQFEQGGFIKRQEGTFKSNISFEQGRLEINGVDRSEMLM